MKSKILPLILMQLLVVCFLRSEETLLVSVSDDRSGRKGGKYGETQDKIEQIFRNNPYFGITKLNMWKWDDIAKTSFYAENKTLLDDIDTLKMCRAYKPYAIYEGLKSLSDGDFLIYTDTSPELWPDVTGDFKIDLSIYDINVIKQLCMKNNDILTIHVKWDEDRYIPMGKPGEHTHAKFTLERCMKKMGMLEYKNSLQHASGMWVIRKSKDTMKLVEEWLYWNLIDECAIIGPASVPGDYSYAIEEGQNFDMDTLIEKKPLVVSHRYDQSISGLLINRRGNKLIEIPEDFWSYKPTNPYNFLQYCRKDKQYTFIDSNITKQPKSKREKNTYTKKRQ